MSDPVFKMIELTGTSEKSTDDAIRNAIERAARTVRRLNWFEVLETRGRIKDGKVSQWQVQIKVGFSLED